MTESLKLISIRGRVSLAIYMLEKTLKSFDIKGKGLELYIAKIKEFTEAEDLGLWHEEIKKLTPEYILNIPYSQEKYDLAKDDYEKIYSDYSKLSSDFLKILELTAWVGISNIYGGTGSHSQTTLDYLLDVLQITADLGVSAPNLDTFLHYKYSEKKGWGKTFNYNRELVQV